MVQYNKFNANIIVEQLVLVHHSHTYSMQLITRLSRSVSHNVPRNLRIVNSESHNSLSKFGSQDMPHCHSLQDIQAELLRQATWQTQVDGNGELVNTQYVHKDHNTQENV